MALTRRVFISSPRDEHLDDRRNDLKWAIVKKIEALGYEPQAFGSPEGGQGLASGRTWSPTDADKVMRRCVGAAILGFPIWEGTATQKGQTVPLVTEYCHYEGALARAQALPILAVLEEGVEERVFFNRYGSDPIIKYPKPADSAWTNEREFQRFLEGWNGRVKQRSDVFFGFSSQATDTAKLIIQFLESIGVKVRNWQTDFRPAGTILDEIEEAASNCVGGIFLFSRDDELVSGDIAHAAPRDNVVFEAGFFMHAVGRERSLIIREEGAKMPADVGGGIYLPLEDRQNISSIETELRRFIEKRL